jgi:hypothetical protein
MRSEVLTALLWNFHVFWCVTLSRWMFFYTSKERSIFILRANQFLRFTLGPLTVRTKTNILRNPEDYSHSDTIISQKPRHLDFPGQQNGS